MVLTHGLRCSPFSTAFLASRAAPIITDGLEVLVHDVIAAIVTAPWSISNFVPSESSTWVGLDGRPFALARFRCQSVGSPPPLMSAEYAGASLAGNDSADASSAWEITPSWESPSST